MPSPAPDLPPTVQNLRWTLAGIEDAVEAHAIHLEAIAGAGPGTVRHDDVGHFVRHAGAEGLLVCCRTAEGDMIAYGILGTASANADVLAALLQLTDAERGRFAILDGVACRPAWRGRQLHRATIAERIVRAQALHRSLLGATVSPHNVISLRGVLAMGFAVTGLALVYGGVDRLLLQRDLAAGQRRWQAAASIDARDLDGQRDALASGLQGYACSEAADGSWLVHYGIPGN